MPTGWIVILLLLLPNAFFLLLKPRNVPPETDGQREFKVQVLETVEKLGQIGCFILPIFYSFRFELPVGAYLVCSVLWVDGFLLFRLDSVHSHRAAISHAVRPHGRDSHPHGCRPGSGGVGYRGQFSFMAAGIGRRDPRRGAHPGQLAGMAALPGVQSGKSPKRLIVVIGGLYACFSWTEIADKTGCQIIRDQCPG